ncbi:MAG: hypothetical protein ACK4WH_12470 [Phycisphaerales bacterium]
MAATPFILGSWALWTASAATAAALLLLIIWLRGDRARDRLRCRGCWYDMRGAPGLTCPECGRLHKDQRAMRRTRRRRWQVGASAFLLLLAAALSGAWFVTDPTRLRHLPTWALIDLIRARRIVGPTVVEHAAEALLRPIGGPRELSDDHLAALIAAWLDVDQLSVAARTALTVPLDFSATGLDLEDMGAWRVFSLASGGDVPADRFALRRLGRSAPWLIPRLDAFLRASPARTSYDVEIAIAILASMSWNSEAASVVVADLLADERIEHIQYWQIRKYAHPRLLGDLAERLDTAEGRVLERLWYVLVFMLDELHDGPTALQTHETPQVRAAIFRLATRPGSHDPISVLVRLPPPPDEVIAHIRELVGEGLGPAPSGPFTEAHSGVATIVLRAGEDAVGALAPLLSDADRYIRFRAVSLAGTLAQSSAPISAPTIETILSALILRIADPEQSVSWAALQSARAQLRRAEVRAMIERDADLRSTLAHSLAAACSAPKASPWHAGRLLDLADLAATLGPECGIVRARLLDIAESGDSSVRGVARQALARLDAKR